MDHRQFVWETLEDGWRKGPWTPQEDRFLIEHVNQHGEGRWNSVSRLTGLKRRGKSCRLRWVNYLRPDLKRGKITPHEEAIILDLHALWGNRWFTIARSLPGRTDNEIKNYWRTHFKKGQPSKKAERTRAWFLKQQEQQTQQQQEEVDQKLAQDDMMMTTQAEVEVEALAQDIQEMPYMYPTSFVFQGGVSTSNDGSGEDCTWGSLWNLDGAWRHGRLDAAGSSAVISLMGGGWYDFLSK